MDLDASTLSRARRPKAAYFALAPKYAKDATFLRQGFLAYLGIFEGRQPLASLALFGTRSLPEARRPPLYQQPLRLRREFRERCHFCYRPTRHPRQRCRAIQTSAPIPTNRQNRLRRDRYLTSPASARVARLTVIAVLLLRRDHNDARKCSEGNGTRYEAPQRMQSIGVKTCTVEFDDEVACVAAE
jgi:hypothetical protein